MIEFTDVSHIVEHRFPFSVEKGREAALNNAVSSIKAMGLRSMIAEVVVLSSTITIKLVKGSEMQSTFRIGEGMARFGFVLPQLAIDRLPDGHVALTFTGWRWAPGD
jgi:hypothetical protein